MMRLIAAILLIAATAAVARPTFSGPSAGAPVVINFDTYASVEMGAKFLGQEISRRLGDPRLILTWNDGDGDPQDLSIKQQTCLYGGTTGEHVRTTHGKAYSLATSSDGYVTVSDAATLSFNAGGVDEVFSAGVWVKIPSSATGTRTLLRKTDEYRIVYDASTGGLDITLGDGTNYIRGVYVVAIEAGWHFLAFSYSASETPAGILVYLDGTLRTGGTETTGGTYTGMTPGSNPVLIGEAGTDTIETSCAFIGGTALSASAMWRIYAISRGILGE